MPKTFIRKSTGWAEIKSVFVKKTTGWTETKSIFVNKLVSSVASWVKVYTKAGLPDTTTSPSLRVTNTGAGTIYDGDVATSPQFLNKDLFGKDGVYTNYTSIFGRKITSATSASALPADRTTVVTGDLFTSGGGVTAADRLALDGKFLFYELTVQNGSSTFEIKPVSQAIKMIKSIPLKDTGLTTSITGTAKPGSTLTFTYHLQNYYYNRVVQSTSKVKWWRSTNGTASGVLLKEEFVSATVTSSSSTSLSGSSTYAVVAADNDYYIVAEVVAFSTWTENNNYPDGYQVIKESSALVTSPYEFAFGNVLHVGTNGYISLDSGNTVDSINSTTGRVIGILPADLQQLDNTSVWYWSDTTQFIIRWEGHVFGLPSNLRQYEIVFDTAQAYAQVYVVETTTGAGGTQAFVKDGATTASYSAGLTTANWRRVFLNGTSAPTSLVGPYAPKSKTVMKQVTGLSSGSLDQGYTSITTATNQNLLPIAPTSLSATTDSSERVRLTWSGGSATYYEFFYGSQTNTFPSSIADFGTAGTITTSPYDFAAPRGFNYYYFVRSVVGTTTTNTKSGWYPATAPGVTGKRLLYPPPTPNTPTTSGVTGTNITVSWTAGTNGTTNDTATSYEVYTSTTNSAPASTTSGTAKTSPAAYTYTASSSPSTQYFWVRGVTEGGNSPWSAAVSATPTAVRPPNNPGTPTAGTITNTSIAWSWTAPTADTTHLAATGYDYVIDSSTADPTGAGTAITTASVTTSSLTKNTDYYLHVRASNADGKSAWVTSAKVTTTNTATSYTVTFKANTGTGADKTQSASTTTALTANTFTKADTFVQPSFTGTLPGWTAANNFQRTTGTGAFIRYGWGNGTQTWSGTINDYTFAGWNTAANGSGTAYANQANYAFTADVTLYAQWTAVRKGRGFNWQLRSSSSVTSTTNITDSGFKSYTTTDDTRATVQSANFPYLLRSDGTAGQRDIVYSANARHGRIQLYQFGTDGNEYNSSWTGTI